MLNNFVNFELLFTKLSGIHPYENALNNQVGMLGDIFLWLVANLKQGGIYFIKQALPPNISAGSVSIMIMDFFSIFNFYLSFYFFFFA